MSIAAVTENFQLEAMPVNHELVAVFIFQFGELSNFLAREVDKILTGETRIDSHNHDVFAKIHDFGNAGDARVGIDGGTQSTFDAGFSIIRWQSIGLSV